MQFRAKCFEKGCNIATLFIVLTREKRQYDCSTEDVAPTDIQEVCGTRREGRQLARVPDTMRKWGLY